MLISQSTNQDKLSTEKSKSSNFFNFEQSSIIKYKKNYLVILTSHFDINLSFQYGDCDEKVLFTTKQKSIVQHSIAVFFSIIIC
jgi:hypothetical protein